jgi:MarR family transcriptional regulator for hemolysin
MRPYDTDLFFVLNDVARLMRTRFDQQARAYGMTRAQWVILIRLQRQPGLSQNELAGICEVEPISVARLVDRLEASGMVERRADPADRRVRRLHLLPAAEPIIAEIERYRKIFREEITKDMTPLEWATAFEVLSRMKDKLTSDDVGSPSAAVGEEA